VNGCSCCKKISDVKMEPLPVQFIPIASCLLHVVPCEERASVLFVVALEVLEYRDEVLLSLLFSGVVGGGWKAGRSSVSLELFYAETVAVVYQLYIW